MKLYTYDGPVLSGFKALLTDKWHGETWASSAEKARVNLAYRFKTANNMLPTVKILLPGNIKEG